MDDGYGNFGGGGSIQWEVAVDPTNKRKRQYKLYGLDELDDKEQYFKITMKKPSGVLIGYDGNALVLAVPVQQDDTKGKPTQLQVQWAYRKAELPDRLDPVPPPGTRR